METPRLKKEYLTQARSLLQNVKRLPRINLRFDYPSRVKLAAILLVFFSFLSSWGPLKKNWKEFDPQWDFSGRGGVALYESRFARLKTMLPAQGIVGYVSDGQPEGAEYYLTQYALSPVIVDPTQPHELVVGNFANRNVDAALHTKMRLTLRGDLGNGVKLFSVESK